MMAFAIGTSTNAYNSTDTNTINIDGQKYVLSFEDNFDGTELDTTKWERCPEEKRQDTIDYWDDDMSYLDGDGNLVIESCLDEKSGKFLSGGVRTHGLFEQAYGYFEIRCKINTVPGYWTAFWLMSGDVLSEKNGGRDGTEIDIFESPYCTEKKIQHTLNWDGYGSAHKAEGKIVDADVYDGNYHTFSLLWTKDEYVFYIDGNESWRTDAQKAQGTCEVPLYLKITSETGSWTGLPKAENFPDYMYVDYVKVYKAAD
jgi:beta-glucanase (GH16 family)